MTAKAYRVQTAEFVGYFEPTLEGLEQAAKAKAQVEQLKVAKIRLVDDAILPLIDGIIRPRKQAEEIRDTYGVHKASLNYPRVIRSYLQKAEIHKGKRRLRALRTIITILNNVSSNPQMVSKIMSFTNLTKPDIEEVVDELMRHGALDKEDIDRAEQLLDILY